MDIENGKNIIRIQKITFKGKDYIDIRKFYQDSETEEWKPTSKGIAFKPELKQDIINTLNNLY